jgi:glycosyltransferase involved in cell wall biosynthesis
MKILIINYRYFVSGGPERYLFNLQDLLQLKGHEVIPFSIHYAKNVETEYSKYFVPSLSKSDEVYFKDQTWNISSLLKTLERSFYSQEVYRSLEKLIEEQKPDCAIVLHYLRKLSPAVLVALSKHNIPFVVRISDFAMICPNAHMIREGKICELCVSGNLANSVRYKCIQNSYSASLINYIAMHYHSLKGYFDLVPKFIVPSSFTKRKMIEAGFSSEKLVHVPTFVYPESASSMVKKKRIIYVGRVEYIKGVSVLLNAVRILKTDHNDESFEVVIVGDGTPAYVEELKMFVRHHHLENVQMIGNVSKEQVVELLKESMISIAPSLWYDNMPNAVLESLACGTPVIASSHGSFPDIVIDKETGFLFEPGNANDLAQKIGQLINNFSLCQQMGENARQFVTLHHSPEKHYAELMEVFSTINSERN